MKYSQPIGILTAIALTGVCYIPWVYIPSIHTTVTGLQSEGTLLGKPGLLSIILSGVNIIFFLIPKIWAKRINVFIAAVNLAWAIKNYLLLTTCQAGECPEKKAGLYLLLLTSFIILLMTFFPKITIPDER